MAEPTSADGLSPLDQIRLVETEITRRIIAARERAERSVENARAQAVLIRKQAREKGEREGKVRYKEIVAKAGEEAKMIVAQAQHEMGALRRKQQSRMEQAVRVALNVVLGAKEDGKFDES
jgi:vacuolar-type H+-ATPase subunit H